MAIKIAVDSIRPLLVGALRFTIGGVLGLLEHGVRPTRGLLWTALGLGLVEGTSSTPP